MSYNINISFPVILILIGIGYLLANLNLIPYTPWELFINYWPALLIFWGLKVFISYCYNKAKHQSHIYELLFSIGLVAIGTTLLTPKIGVEINFLSWQIIWPSLLIIFGVVEIFSKRNSKISNHKRHTSFIGEIHKGGENWLVDDMHLRHFVGEVHLDLTKAIIPNKEVKIEITGIVGEVTLYLPKDIPLNANCRVNVGDISVLDEHHEGFGKSLSLRTPDYDQFQRKINLFIQWKVGEVKVKQIG